MEGQAVPEKPNDNSQKPRAPNFLPCWPPLKTKDKVQQKARNPFDEIAEKQKSDRQIISKLKSNFRADKFMSFSQAQIAEALDAIISQWGQVKIPLRECVRLCDLLDDVTAVGFLGRRIPILIGRILERRCFSPMINSHNNNNVQ